MTGPEMLARVEGYYGAYPADRPVLEEEVAAYLMRQRPTYLDALWVVLRDRRDQYKGPPDIKALRDLYETAVVQEQYRRPKALPAPTGQSEREYVAGVLERLVSRLRSGDTGGVE